MSGSRRPLRWAVVSSLVSVMLLAGLAPEAQARSVAVASVAPLGADSFTREVDRSWGRDDLGNVWTTNTYAPGDYRVDGSAGVITLRAPGARRQALLLGSPRERDVTQHVLVRTDKAASGGGQMASLVARRVADNREYRVRVRFDATGIVRVGAFVLRGGTSEIAIAPEVVTGGVTHAAGVGIHVRSEVVGSTPTTIRARVWREGAVEPAQWQLVVGDSEPTLQGAGAYGVQAYASTTTSNPPINFAFDDYEAHRVDAASGDPLLADPASIYHTSPRTTQRPVPSTGTVLFVAPDGDDTNPGTLARPLRSVAGAVQTAPAGATIVVRGGVYREQIGAVAKRLTIQAYPGEQVWLDGAVVIATSEWVPDRGVWRRDGWLTDLQANCYEPKLVAPGTTPQLPDMVFVDGVAQTQVTALDQVRPGTFYVDRARGQLFVGTNPAGRLVEATRYAIAMRLVRWPSSSAAGTELHGLGFRRYGSHQRPASGCPNPAQVVVNGGDRSYPMNVAIRDSTFFHSAGAGLGIYSAGGTSISNSSFIDNGFNGLQVDKASAMRVQGVELARNNREGFLYLGTADAGQTAGAKFSATLDLVVSDSVVSGNRGTGLWCDLGCDGVSFVRNRVHGNAKHGLYIEVSRNAVVASNLSYDNGHNGVQVKGEAVKVFNNTLVGNNQNIAVYEDGRVPVGQPYACSGDPGWSTIFPTTKKVSIWNNLSVDATGSHRNEYDLDPSTVTFIATHPCDPVRKDPEQMLDGLDYDLYVRSAGRPALRLVGWQGSTWGATNAFASLSLFRAAVPSMEVHGGAVDGIDLGQVFVDRARGDFTLVPGSPALARGRPLTSAEAAAIGVSPFVAVDVGALAAPGPP